jgi:hypothetical protein
MSGLTALLATLARELLDGEVVKGTTLGGSALPHNTLELTLLERRTLLLDKGVALYAVAIDGDVSNAYT